MRIIREPNEIWAGKYFDANSNVYLILHVGAPTKPSAVGSRLSSSVSSLKAGIVCRLSLSQTRPDLTSLVVLSSRWPASLTAASGRSASLEELGYEVRVESSR